ncbi:MAG: substrate-binding domain-containing protein [Oscillospiraceae bacterium]|nr:substrate-binding domain-containing protein [Oscillospiraceae bacterium]
MTEKSMIGIIAAEVNNIEQSQIVKGIIASAQSFGRRTVIFSNLYNNYEYSEALALENSIYDLVYSPQLRGIVLIQEAIINEKLRSIIYHVIEQRQDIPVVVIGLYFPALDMPNVRFIDTDDEDDIAEVVRHFLEVHQLTKIDLLTGFQGQWPSERRVAGYRRMLESHGIPYDPSRVHYGDFWVSSGISYAKRYISGELPMPEAIVCANDHMAYGLLDTFLENGIRVPQDVRVAGYEYIHERIYHTPMLSTYCRGRNQIGQNAVMMLETMAKGEPLPSFRPPKGTWISGESCGCHSNLEQLREEVERMRTKQQYEKWNVLGTQEQQLTLCSTLEEFIDVLGKHQYMIRWVQNMYLCLFENWYDTSATEPVGMLTCRSVMPWYRNRPPVTCTPTDFHALFVNAPDTANHFYVPLFFEQHIFGYYVLEYYEPDSYDDVFRNWMKTVSIGLTFLCMKNDIRYLLQCQNLSEHHDALTGVYNLQGAEKVLSVRLSSAAEPLYSIAVKFSVFQMQTRSQQTEFLTQVADVLRNFVQKDGICCRIDQQIFLCTNLPCHSMEECEMLMNRLSAVLLHSTNLLKERNMHTVLYSALKFEPNTDVKECFAQVQQKLAEETSLLAQRQSSPHTSTLYVIRNRLYETLALSADIVCKEYSFSAGYFRQIYKDCFGISFHQDTINARIYHAIYLLSTTVMSIASIAEKCGYEDYNYFLRQFQKVTGMTPGQYRKNV